MPSDSGASRDEGQILRDIIGNKARTRDERLLALKSLVSARSASSKKLASYVEFASCVEVNNHIHTIYSFSPYTPAMAALRAFEAGLAAAGSVDHDSVGAAIEMLQAGEILGIGACVGFELRANYSGTSFEDMKLNNPDSVNMNYMTVQGIPRAMLDMADAFLKPIRERRNERNRSQTIAASSLFSGAGLGAIDFDKDVLPLSMAHEGGGITERHILAALANRLIATAAAAATSAGRNLKELLREGLGVEASGKVAARIVDSENPHRLYDLLGLLKAEFLPRFFIQPNEGECIPVREAVAFARSIGAIPAYAYLGDVGESPTGDKKAEKFEDGILDELVPGLAKLGFQAIAYMPPRNTRAQLARVKALASANGLLEISGVDINNSRQSFNCPELRLPEFRHLVDSTWALIGHERLSALGNEYGFFHPENPLRALSLDERVTLYATIGRVIAKNPEADIKALFNAKRRK